MKHSVVIVNDFGHVNGGAAQICIADILALARAGHDVTFFCAVGPISPDLVAAGIKVVCLDEKEIATDPDRIGAARRGLWNGRAQREMDRLLSSFATAPIVHIHGWSKALSGSVVAAAVDRRVPTVLTLHDFFAACPNGGFYQYPQQRICELRAMSPACIACNCDSRSYPQKLYRVMRQTLQRHAGHLPDGIRHFTYYSQLALRVMQPYLPDHAQLHFVPNALEGEREAPVAVGENEDFVLVGRLSPEKGTLHFADAAARAGIRPVYLGEGRMRDEILARAPHAEITGWLSREALFARLKRARALVFPSLWYETFGLTVGEALMRGIPVIVSDRTAAAELVEDGRNGLLFHTGDVEDLARQITRLKEPALAANLGAAAYARYWSDPLTETRHTSALLKVYEAMASR